MPTVNRRHFLQIAGAASLAPAMPALSAGGSTTAGGLTTSQKLWAGLYARPGSTQNIAGIAQSMGISDGAAHSVYSRLVQTRVIAAQGAVKIARTARVATEVSNVSSAKQVMKRPTIKVDVKKFLTEDVEDEADGCDQQEFEDRAE